MAVTQTTAALEGESAQNCWSRISFLWYNSVLVDLLLVYGKFGVCDVKVVVHF